MNYKTRIWTLKAVAISAFFFQDRNLTQTNLLRSIVLAPRPNVQLPIADIAMIETLYRQHGRALVLFAVALTGERSRAQDAVHQVFLKLLERGSLGHIVDRKAYLFTCVRNAILNNAKVRKADAALNHECTWFDPPNRDYAAELKLRRALGALSDDQRQVTVLHIWGELTFSQIAEVLGISPNTVASRYRYALANLRDAMCTQEKPHAHP